MPRVVTFALALVLIAGFLVLLWAGQRGLIYFPDPSVPGPAAVGLPDARELTLTTDDGLRLGAWFVAAPHARFTVIVFNGNAGNRAYRAPLAAAFQKRGWNVLLFDYRGYGGNPGSPSERGLAADAVAARAQVLSLSGIDRAGLIYFGESLGSAVATALAARHPPAALVLRSPFTSLTDVGRYHYPVLPVGLLLRDRFDSYGTIERVHIPTMVIAGDRDTIVPVEQSRRLFDRLQGPRKLMVLPWTDHNDAALSHGDEMVSAIASFLDGIRATQ